MEDILGKIKDLIAKVVAVLKKLIEKITGKDIGDPDKPADTEETTGE